jgi:drug/metabolite transporter (DMT)-like permease
MARETGREQAAGYVLAAMALLGLIDNLVPLIAAEAGLWQFHATRSAMALPAIWALAGLRGVRLRPLRPGAVAARSALIAAAMMLYFGCLAVLPIGQVAAGLFTAPIWVLMISAFALGHRVGPAQVTAVALGFAGILAILNPGGAGLSAIAAVPVLAGLLYAVGQIGTRAWCAGEGTLTLLFGFFAALGAMGLVGLGVLAVLPEAGSGGRAAFVTTGWVAPSGAFLLWTAVQAIGSILAVGLLFRAYQIGEAGRVAVFEYALLLFASLWAWALWAQGIDLATAGGMAAIALAGGLIARRPPSRPPARA